MNDNFHVHTKFSDGFFLPEEICEQAKNQGLKKIGFSDHLFGYKPSLYSKRQFEEYINNILQARDLFPLLDLYIGGELDLTSFDETFLPLIKDFDYLNIEYFHTFSDLKKIDKVRSIFSKPIFLVHIFFNEERSDDFTHFYIKKKKYHKLITELNNLRIGIELTDGTRNILERDGKREPYFIYNKDFYEEAKNSLIPLTIGTDFHSDWNELACLQKSRLFIKEMELEENIQISYHLLKK